MTNKIIFEVDNENLLRAANIFAFYFLSNSSHGGKVIIYNKLH